ncbi:hypothetical protein [Streptosporangium roseum]|uniref:hypothetical protein n=1 Tax=Streptosporangium roseum TaxID=2001 RepID=UPI00331DFE66
MQKIGRGQNRTAYLVGGIVHKVDEWPPENLHDHRILQRARHAGMPWAPPSALFELEDGNGRKQYVIVLPDLAPGAIRELRDPDAPDDDEDDV